MLYRSVSIFALWAYFGAGLLGGRNEDKGILLLQEHQLDLGGFVLTHTYTKLGKIALKTCMSWCFQEFITKY